MTTPTPLLAWRGAVRKKDALAAIRKKDALAAIRKKDALAAIRKKDALAAIRKKDALAAIRKKDALAAIRKKDALAAIRKHRERDALIAGAYWSERYSRGCAVGCTLHDFAPGHESSHRLYEPLFGIPEELARFEDTIFEALPHAEAQLWPERFLAAAKAGSNLRPVLNRFIYWLLSGEDSPLAEWRAEAHVSGVAALYSRRLAGDEPDQGEWTAAWTAASDAASAAASDAAWTAASDAAWTTMSRKLLEIVREAP